MSTILTERFKGAVVDYYSQPLMANAAQSSSLVMDSEHLDYIEKVLRTAKEQRTQEENNLANLLGKLVQVYSLAEKPNFSGDVIERNSGWLSVRVKENRREGSPVTIITGRDKEYGPRYKAAEKGDFISYNESALKTELQALLNKSQGLTSIKHHR